MRENIIVQLESLLNASVDIQTVFRQFRLLDTVSNRQYPCVFIEEDLPELGYAWKSSGYADVRFQVNLLEAVHSPNNVASTMNNFDVAVKKVIAANPTLNGSCMRATLEPETERLGTQYAPYGLVRRPVTIIYEGSATNGY